MAAQPHMSASGPPRLGAGPVATALALGPLAPLVGTWAGRGFNAIWRPDNEQPPENSKIKRFLELNLTSETFEFETIPGVVPNRGFATQPDLGLFGLHYLQRVTDADPPVFSTAGQALHIEPGFFMNVPASVVPPNPASIVRLATIPHGVSLLMQGVTPSATPVDGPPEIPPIFPIPGLPKFEPAPGALGLGLQPVDIPLPGGDGAEHKVEELDITKDGAGSQSNGPYPMTFQGFVNDPNSLLRDQIEGQEILGTVAIKLTTERRRRQHRQHPLPGNPQRRRTRQPDHAQRVRALRECDLLDRVGPPQQRPPAGPARTGAAERRGDRRGTVRGRTALPAAAVHPDRDPGLQQSALAARHRGHAHAQRGVAGAGEASQRKAGREARSSLYTVTGKLIREGRPRLSPAAVIRARPMSLAAP